MNEKDKKIFEWFTKQWKNSALGIEEDGSSFGSDAALAIQNERLSYPLALCSLIL